MSKFFDRYENAVSVGIDDLLPGPSASETQKERAVYEHYINSIAQFASDANLRPFREKAMRGRLEDRDMGELNVYFEGVQKEVEKTVESTEEVLAYSGLKTLCMHVAQILFLDNIVKEGLKVADLAELSKNLSRRISGATPKLDPADVQFYAEMFIHQAAFDLLFVTHDPPGVYDALTGNYRRCEHYDEATVYLDLCAIKEYEASANERRLCQNITTNWCRHISRSAWDRLNACYYGGISSTTGKPNLFTTHYDLLLEYMLPQWPYSRAVCANTLLAEVPANKHFNVIELGAGSGSFAIDLFMSAKKQKRSIDAIAYLGIEPSDFMMKHVGANMKTRIGNAGLPEHWAINKGTLEAFCSDCKRFALGDAVNLIVLCGTAHHVHHRSLEAFLTERSIKERYDSIYVLDTTARHGWTKPYYMWADCESPECFDNVERAGIWKAKTLWEEPQKPVDRAPGLTNSWASLRKLI